MSIKLSKKTSVIVAMLLFFVVGGTGGYLLWRVNQDKTVAPTDSDAGNCTYYNLGECKEYEGGCTEDNHTKGCGYGMGTPSPGTAWCQTYSIDCSSDCGDGTCSSDETATSCPADCTTCGDNLCTGSETLASCPGDCSVCGDNQCTGSETLASCPGDCSVCGDNKCTGPETGTTCVADCVCKALVWGNKPGGTYKPDIKTLSPISITNPNSASSTTTGVSIKLNETTLSQCGSVAEANCFNVSANATAQQEISLKLFGGQSTIEEGTYVISVTLPGASDPCVESATFTIAADVVVVTEEVPDTGIFDGVLSKIYLGTGFVFLGIVTTQFSKFSYIFNGLGERNKVVLEERKRKREEDKRNRFERRFK